MNRPPFAAVVALIVPLAVVLAALPQRAAAESWVHKAAGLQLWTPDDWTAEEDGGVLQLTAPGSALSISLTPLEAGEIDAALAGIDESLASVVDDFEPDGEFERIELGGLDGALLTGSGEIEGEPVEIELALVATPTGKVMLVLLIAHADEYERQSEVIDRIFDSIQAAPADKPPAPSGALVLRYEPGSDAVSQAIAGYIQQAGVFDEVAAGLSGVIILPRDIPVVVRNCGEPNAFYSPADGRIAVCYELIQWFSALFASDEELSDQERAEHVVNAAVFTLLHELGHALIDVLDIPATGKEEDAVDDLAALLLLKSGQEQTALSAVGQFALATVNMDEEAEFAFWDEHSLDPQRMYSLVCLILGSDPERYPDLADVLPPERAVRCPSEYERKSRSWGQLLDKHLRGSGR